MNDYRLTIKALKQKKRVAYSKMEGYVFGVVRDFDNVKGIGTAIDSAGNTYTLHFANFSRITHKVLSPGHTIHFKPGVFNSSSIADDVAVVP